jgi:hypothetical protein
VKVMAVNLLSVVVLQANHQRRANVFV